MLELTVEFPANAEPWYLGYLAAIFVELERAGRAAVELRAAPRLNSTGASIVVSCERRWRAVIELSDHADHVDEGLLADCDVYLKRNFNPARLPSLSAAAQGRIQPFGLYYACTSRRSIVALTRALGRNLVGKQRLKDLYRYLVAPHWRDFEQGPTVKVADAILYQARVWEAHDSPGDEQVNEERVGLLRELRRAFGARVRGGLVATPYAVQRYPDLVSTAKSRQPEFIRWSKEALIGIYFRGLYHSYGYKMVEFLASSKCIVSEPLQNALPRPLVEGQDYLGFPDAASCVAHCDRVLSSASLQRELRAAAWSYYTDQVRPARRGQLFLDDVERFVGGRA